MFTKIPEYSRFVATLLSLFMNLPVTIGAAETLRFRVVNP